MSKLIPQNFIDDLLARVDIVDIVGSRVKLRRTGSNLVGLCPFHTEKTPSFSVSQNKQFFHCFGCHVHGNAISFIMQFERLTFVEAIENLAAQLGLPVPKTDNFNDKTRYTELYQVTAKVVDFLVQQLTKSPRAINYLKLRGLTGEICKKFKVGYAPNDWENLRPLYNTTNIDLMTTAGLLVTKNNKIYSRFRDRIMFPIHNTRGQIIGLGGRAIDDDPAKYLNSPETPIFHKGEELYGLYEAKRVNNNLKSMIVVEGYLDVIALAQFGITNVTATLGTAISTKQIQLLLRHTTEIVFCFDGDRAGHAAAWRALENSLPLMRDGIQVKFLFLPDGHDPDSLIRKESPESFKNRFASALPLSDFLLNHLTTDLNINTIDGKAKLTKIGKELLKKMPHGIFYQLLIDKIAALANVNADELQDQGTDHHWTTPPPAVEQAATTNLANIPLQIQLTISILLHYPGLASQLEDTDSIKDLSLNGIDIVRELIILLKNQPNLTMGAILEYWRDRQELEILQKFACKEPIIPKEVLKNELIDIIQSLKQLEREAMIQKLLTKATIETLDLSERTKLQTLITTSKKRVENL